MAISARAIRAGAAYVELLLNDNALVRGLANAQKKLKNFGSAVRSIGSRLTLLGAGAAAGFVPAIKAASDAEEGMNKFSAVFGSESAAAGKFVEKLAADVGRSASEIRDSMSSYQGMFVGLGFDPNEAREMSQSLQSLALDFGSFFNVSDQEAGERFLAGLSGSSEVFDKFGINTKASALDQKFLEMGIAETTATATEQQKVLARVAIIMESMGRQGAIGDAVKTSGSLANQMKRTQAGIKDMAETVGRALLPVISPLVTKLNSYLKIAGEWIANNNSLVVTIAKVAAGILAGGIALSAMGTILTSLGAIVGVFTGAISLAATAVGVLGTVIAAIFTPIGALVAVIGLVAAAMVDWAAVGENVSGFFGRVFSTIKKDAMAAFGGIADAMAAGDLGLAAQILWATLKLEWQRGIAALSRMWEDFVERTKDNVKDEFTFGIHSDLKKVKGGVGILGGMDSNAAKALKEQEALIDKAQKQREAMDAKRKTDPVDDPELSQAMQDLDRARAQLNAASGEFGTANTTALDSSISALSDEIDAGAMAFDTFAGDLRNTAIEMGSADAQSAIIDAITGRNSPYKTLEKAMTKTATSAEKIDKNTARQTDLMRSGVRLIVENA